MLKPMMEPTTLNLTKTVVFGVKVTANVKPVGSRWCVAQTHSRARPGQHPVGVHLVRPQDPTTRNNISHFQDSTRQKRTIKEIPHREMDSSTPFPMVFFPPFAICLHLFVPISSIVQRKGFKMKDDVLHEVLILCAPKEAGALFYFFAIFLALSRVR